MVLTRDTWKQKDGCGGRRILFEVARKEIQSFLRKLLGEKNPPNILDARSFYQVTQKTYSSGSYHHIFKQPPHVVRTRVKQTFYTTVRLFIVAQPSKCVAYLKSTTVGGCRSTKNIPEVGCSTRFGAPYYFYGFD